MRLYVFDLGDTLVEYEGIPLSWEAHYAAALENLGRSVGVAATGKQIEEASAVLRRYNTRLAPREHEVQFSEILCGILGCFGIETVGADERSAEIFFSVFRQRLRCFDDTRECLIRIRSRGDSIGVLTDVPYGMPTRLVVEDITAAGLGGFFDAVITSVDAGVRKPNVGGLELLATQLQVQPHEMTFVGNERKDVEVALRFGCEAVLLDRARVIPDWKADRTISSLSEL